MNRSMLVMLGLGAGACIAMSVMLQYALRAQAENVQLPVIGQLEQAYGSLLQGSIRLEIEQGQGLPPGVAQRDGEPAGKVIARLDVMPKPGRSTGTLARDLGQMVWRAVGSARILDGVQVVFLTTGKTFNVPAPYFPGRKMRHGSAPQTVAPSTPEKGADPGSGKPTPPGSKANPSVPQPLPAGAKASPAGGR